MPGGRSTRLAAAFSEEIRIRLLRLLRERERNVGDLVAATGVPQPSVSRHLACLRRAGLVRARAEGSHRFYRLAPADHPFHACLLACLGRCLAGSADEESGIGSGVGPPGRDPQRPRGTAARTRVKISG